MTKGAWEDALVTIGKAVAKAMGLKLGWEATRPELEAKAPTKRRVSIEDLPLTGGHFVGRDKELAQLDAAWEDPHTHLFSIVAWGGAGKSALVNHWLGQLAREDWRGAVRVFAWSFYSQGTREQQATSADPFIDAALRWFEDPEPPPKSPTDRGRRLATLVRQHRTLLVLDGLEPMQHPPGPLAGRLKDPALQALLRALAADNPGLCLITTREAIEDVAHQEESTAPRLELERLSTAAGVALLKTHNVEGSEKQLQKAVERFDGHALALALLGTYLRTACKGDVRRAKEIPLGEANEHAGGHAFRVMEAYAHWLGPEKPEVAVLRLLGLFDRPAPSKAIAALRNPPPISGLTEPLADLSTADWTIALTHLRDCGLLAPPDPEDPEVLDAHPLVRAYFGERLEKEQPAAWKEGHARLYEHYKGEAPDQPDNLETMLPLFTAVHHGCRAGQKQEALDEVYKRRIQRMPEFYCKHKLGALSAELGALAGFFDPPWERPSADLKAADHAWILNEAGFDLRALGRLREAIRAMDAGLEAQITAENWQNAAIQAGNLSELSLTLGDLAPSVSYGEQGVELADRSGEAAERRDNRTTLADALHLAGRFEESAAAFRAAEAMQAERQPQYPLLYSLAGYRYCDLLLGRAEAQAWPAPGAEEVGRLEEACRAVKERAEKTLAWVQPQNWILDIALDHLSLGRAHLGLALAHRHGAAARDPAPDLHQAAKHLDQAVEGLRRSGQEDDQPRGLLARAALRRVQDELPAATRDLEEALEIAERGDMALHRCDTHLEWARLCTETGARAQAREHFTKAKALVAKHGYHRRDLEVEILTRVLM